ncbi:hypothetical protein IEQ34_019065 [Dendrobium chrysotoxum]|uniref:Uncharacterized protein n=1 Tax=Dendrobium chrysotoxum TaxID=161865 RepID=A0AAV7G5V2_DENCH|nr:hypothetical protein IEQ34_019065 [Dendrobium chrysotoxum]
MKDLPATLHVEEEDIMRILKLPDIKHLLFEVRHMSRYIEEKFLFKSIAFKTIFQDHIQEARDHIYHIEVKALEQQCIEDGFIRGFLKGVCLMQRKTRVQVEDGFPSGFYGDEIESELQKAFDLDVDDETDLDRLDLSPSFKPRDRASAV